MGIAERLRLLRGKETRESLARKLNIHPQTLYRYENGERDVPLDVIIAFCNHYDISAEWLIFERGVKNVSYTDQSSVSSSETETINSLKARIEQLERELFDSQKETIKAYRLATAHMQPESDNIQKPEAQSAVHVPAEQAYSERT